MGQSPSFPAVARGAMTAGVGFPSLRAIMRSTSAAVAHDPTVPSGFDGTIGAAFVDIGEPEADRVRDVLTFDD